MFGNGIQPDTSMLLGRARLQPLAISLRQTKMRRKNLVVVHDRPRDLAPELGQITPHK